MTREQRWLCAELKRADEAIACNERWDRLIRRGKLLGRPTTRNEQRHLFARRDTLARILAIVEKAQR